MTRIERIEEMRLDAEREAEIAALLLRAFGPEFDGRSYFQQRHHVRLLWREEGALLGHLAICLRDIRVDGVLRTICGLAEVCTDPDARGRGIASRLVRAAIDEARAGPAEFLTLFGDAALYAAAGFVPCRNVLRHVAMVGARTGVVQEAPTTSLMVLPLRGTEWPAEAAVDLMGHKF